MGFLMEQSTRSVDFVLKEKLFPQGLPALVSDLPSFLLTNSYLKWVLSGTVRGRRQTDCIQNKDLLSQKGVFDLL